MVQSSEFWCEGEKNMNDECEKNVATNSRFVCVSRYWFDASKFSDLICDFIIIGLKAWALLLTVISSRCAASSNECHAAGTKLVLSRWFLHTHITQFSFKFEKIPSSPHLCVRVAALAASRLINCCLPMWLIFELLIRRGQIEWRAMGIDWFLGSGTIAKFIILRYLHFP